MNEHEDLRIVKTKRAVEGALAELLAEEPLEKVTVGQICERALVNKGTFYRHYSDKYALAEACAREALERFDRELDGRLGALEPEPGSSDVVKATILALVASVDDIRLFSGVEVGGRTVREAVCDRIADVLRPYAARGVIRESVETEAWVVTLLVLDYRQYCDEVDEPVGLRAYATAIHEIVDIYYAALAR